MAKMGIPSVENPKSHKVTVKFTEEEVNRLSDYAKEHTVTVAQVVRDAVKEYINQDRK